MDSNLLPYYIIEFLGGPITKIGEYVCVPGIWIVEVLSARENKVVIAYPEERQEITDVLVRHCQAPTAERSWKFYTAFIKYTADTYEGAMAFLRRAIVVENVRRHALQSHTVRESEELRRPQGSHPVASTSSEGLRLVEDYVAQPFMKRSASSASDYNNAKRYRTAAGMTISNQNTNTVHIQIDVGKMIYGDSKLNPETRPMLSETPQGLNQPASFETFTETYFSTEDRNTFITSTKRLEEVAALINEARMTLFKGITNYNETVNVMNMNINQKYRIPFAILPKELLSAIPGAEMQPEDKESDDECYIVEGVTKAEHGSFTLPPDYDQKDSRWTLRYRTPVPGLVELMPHSGVYVHSRNFEDILTVAMDAKKLARNLMVEIFSDNALKVCSLTGAPSLRNAQATQVRPGLDEHARAIIFTFVRAYGRIKGWPEINKPEIQEIKKSMASKLCLIRSKGEV